MSHPFRPAVERCRSQEEAPRTCPPDQPLRLPAHVPRWITLKSARRGRFSFVPIFFVQGASIRHFPTLPDCLAQAVDTTAASQSPPKLRLPQLSTDSRRQIPLLSQPPPATSPQSPGPSPR